MKYEKTNEKNIIKRTRTVVDYIHLDKLHEYMHNAETELSKPDIRAEEAERIRGLIKKWKNILKQVEELDAYYI